MFKNITGIKVSREFSKRTAFPPFKNISSLPCCFLAALKLKSQGNIVYCFNICLTQSKSILWWVFICHMYFCERSIKINKMFQGISWDYELGTDWLLFKNSLNNIFFKKNIYTDILRMWGWGALGFKYFNYEEFKLFWYEYKMNTQVHKWDKQDERK